jgi:beta-1,4-mannosyl-glycoprotein beta-1,4-N-acetylglucosaminyltransferase
MTILIDCFIFYNEVDMLDYRLNILDSVVDFFVIVESTHTFVGKKKPLYFLENYERFEKFKDKIIHVIVDDFPFKTNVDFSKNQQWDNEHFQRNCISRGLNYLKLKNNDVLIVSDLDEIPDPRTLNKIKLNEIKVTVNSLEMDLYYYNLRAIYSKKWCASKVILYKLYIESKLSFEEIRSLNASIIKQGGWHLSYFGSVSFIKNKIQNFSHQEFNNNHITDEDRINTRIQNNTDLYDRNSVVFNKKNISENEYLPLQYETYLKKYI